MKINDLLSNPSGVPGMPSKDDIKVKQGTNADFRTHLAKAGEINYEQHLEKLVKDIVSQGEILAKRIDVKELRTYRRLISEFLDLALGNSKKFSKQNLLDRRGRRKVYAIIKNVNEELDLLIQDIMNEEKGNINLLKRLDDIRGLILDLLM